MGEGGSSGEDYDEQEQEDGVHPTALAATAASTQSMRPGAKQPSAATASAPSTLKLVSLPLPPPSPVAASGKTQLQPQPQSQQQQQQVQSQTSQQQQQQQQMLPHIGLTDWQQRRLDVAMHPGSAHVHIADRANADAMLASGRGRGKAAAIPATAAAALTATATAAATAVAATAASAAVPDALRNVPPRNVLSPDTTLADRYDTSVFPPDAPLVALWVPRVLDSRPFDARWRPHEFARGIQAARLNLAHVRRRDRGLERWEAAQSERWREIEKYGDVHTKSRLLRLGSAELAKAQKEEQAAAEAATGSAGTKAKFGDIGSDSDTLSGPTKHTPAAPAALAKTPAGSGATANAPALAAAGALAAASSLAATGIGTGAGAGSTAPARDSSVSTGEASSQGTPYRFDPRITDLAAFERGLTSVKKTLHQVDSSSGADDAQGKVKAGGGVKVEHGGDDPDNIYHHPERLQPRSDIDHLRSHGTHLGPHYLITTPTAHAATAALTPAAATLPSRHSDEAGRRAGAHDSASGSNFWRAQYTAAAMAAAATATRAIAYTARQRLGLSFVQAQQPQSMRHGAAGVSTPLGGVSTPLGGVSTPSAVSLGRGGMSAPALREALREQRQEYERQHSKPFVPRSASKAGEPQDGAATAGPPSAVRGQSESQSIAQLQAESKSKQAQPPSQSTAELASAQSHSAAHHAVQKYRRDIGLPTTNPPHSSKAEGLHVAAADRTAATEPDYRKGCYLRKFFDSNELVGALKYQRTRLRHNKTRPSIHCGYVLGRVCRTLEAPVYASATSGQAPGLRRGGSLRGAGSVGSQAATGTEHAGTTDSSSGNGGAASGAVTGSRAIIGGYRGGNYTSGSIDRPPSVTRKTSVGVYATNDTHARTFSVPSHPTAAATTTAANTGAGAGAGHAGAGASAGDSTDSGASAASVGVLPVTVAMARENAKQASHASASGTGTAASTAAAKAADTRASSGEGLVTVRGGSKHSPRLDATPVTFEQAEDDARRRFFAHELEGLSDEDGAAPSAAALASKAQTVTGSSADKAMVSAAATTAASAAGAKTASKNVAQVLGAKMWEAPTVSSLNKTKAAAGTTATAVNITPTSAGGTHTASPAAAAASNLKKQQGKGKKQQQHTQAQAQTQSQAQTQAQAQLQAQQERQRKQESDAATAALLQQAKERALTQEREEQLQRDRDRELSLSSERRRISQERDREQQQQQRQRDRERDREQGDRERSRGSVSRDREQRMSMAHMISALASAPGASHALGGRSNNASGDRDRDRDRESDSEQAVPGRGGGGGSSGGGGGKARGKGKGKGHKRR